MDFDFYCNGVCCKQENDMKQCIILKNAQELGCRGGTCQQETNSETIILIPVRDDR